MAVIVMVMVVMDKREDHDSIRNVLTSAGQLQLRLRAFAVISKQAR